MPSLCNHYKRGMSMKNDDLISRAAAIAEIDEYIEEYSELEPETGYHNLKWCAMSEAKDVLTMLPAVNAALVRHGHWIDWKDEHQCSECRETTIVDYYVWSVEKFNFCPYCGANMDEVEISL